MSRTDSNVAIVGAGPYGLSLAAHLRASGVPFRIFGYPMFSWRQQMPRGMSLKSEGFASDIYDPQGSFRLKRFCEETGREYADVGKPVTLDTFVSYGLEFQRRMVPNLEATNIEKIRRASNRYALTTATGETFEAARVVIAAGVTHFGHIPPEFAGHPAELLTHSSAHNDLNRFKGQGVAVLGAGASAVDIAALLHENGAHVHLIARRRAIAFHEPSVEPRPLLKRIFEPRSGLGVGWRSRLCTDAPLLFHLLPERLRLRVVRTHLGPAPGWFMKDRVVGRFPIYCSASIDQIQRQGTQLSVAIRQQTEVTRVVVDHLIAATGFRPDIARLKFLDADLRGQISTADQAPVLDRNFESSVRGLYFVGLASANSFGPLARFAYGAGFTAQRLGRHLMAHRDSLRSARGFASDPGRG